MPGGVSTIPTAETPDQLPSPMDYAASPSGRKEDPSGVNLRKEIQMGGKEDKNRENRGKAETAEKEQGTDVVEVTERSTGTSSKITLEPNLT